MDRRTGEILTLLLGREDFLTTSEAAEILGVSAKTISRQLPKVEEELAAVGLTLEKKSGAGLLVAGDADARRTLGEKLKNDTTTEYTPDERRAIIVIRLLSSREPLKLFALSSELNVTDSTVSNDLDKLAPTFHRQNLKLIRKPGLGVALVGNERDLRRAIVAYIYDHIGEENLLKFAQDAFENLETPITGRLTKYFVDLNDAESWRKTERIVRDLEEDLGYKFSDDALIGLIVHLALSIHRIRQHEPFGDDPKLFAGLRDTREFAAAARSAEKISEVFGIEMPESEIFYATIHIIGAKGRYDETNVANLSMMDNFRIVRFSRMIMQLAAKLAGRPIDKSRTLLAGLINHLAPTINRIQMHLDIRNPLLDEMKTHYPELMDLAKNSVGEVEAELGERFPESELAYIAMHLGAALSDTADFLQSEHRVAVACPSGMGTSHLLASRLKNFFPSVRVIAEVPILEITPELVAEESFEFIISTAPVNCDKCPVVLVSAMLTDEDRKKISDEITRQNKKFLSSVRTPSNRPDFLDALAKMNRYATAISTLMSNYFFVRKDVPDIVTAAKFAGEMAGCDEKSRAEIAKDLLKREDAGGTVISGRRLVLMHCRSEFVKAATFGILQLGEGFKYPEDGEIVRTAIVLLAPKDADECTIETIGRLASVLLERWGLIEILHESDGHEIRHEMLKIFEDFYKFKFHELIDDDN